MTAAGTCKGFAVSELVFMRQQSLGCNAGWPLPVCQRYSFTRQVSPNACFSGRQAKTSVQNFDNMFGTLRCGRRKIPPGHQRVTAKYCTLSRWIRWSWSSWGLWAAPLQGSTFRMLCPPFRGSESWTPFSTRPGAEQPTAFHCSI